MRVHGSVKNPLTLGLAALLFPVLAVAQTIQASLEGFQEVPAFSTGASGTFKAKIDDVAGTITFELSYSGLEGAVAQAHIHVGQAGANGGISAFLCTNLGNGPAGTQSCPASPATVTGVIQASDVVGPTDQGVAAGEFAELVRAIRAGVSYANVHSALSPGGEIRGQIK